MDSSESISIPGALISSLLQTPLSSFTLILLIRLLLQ
jgi:hypothetical protein